MNFGMLHLARPDQAISEACRVLRAGGRFGFTVWAKPVETAGFGITLGAIPAHGDMNVALPEGPPFFRFSEWDECVRSLLQAGFVDSKVKRFPRPGGFRLLIHCFETMQTATVRTAGLLRVNSAGAQGIRGMMANASRLTKKRRL